MKIIYTNYIPLKMEVNIFVHKYASLADCGVFFAGKWKKQGRYDKTLVFVKGNSRKNHQKDEGTEGEPLIRKMMYTV